MAKDDKKRPRKLINLAVEEVSLVDFPANNTPFFLIKNRSIEMDEELAALIAAASGDAVAAEKGADRSAQIKGALITLQEWKEDLAPDILKAIGVLAANLAVEKAEPEKEAEPGEVTIEQLVDAAVEKAGAKFSKETKSALDGILSELKAAFKTLSDLMKHSTVMQKAEVPEGGEPTGGAEKAEVKTYSQADVDKLVSDAKAETEARVTEEVAAATVEETLAAIESR